MSTRGLYGVRKNGIDKCTYNHSDSYPDWLGRKITEFVMNNTPDTLDKFYKNITMVKEEEKPTKEQIESCKANGFLNLSVDAQSETSWYCLLRNLQGNFATYQTLIDNDSAIFMIDDKEFIKDSLFCEHAYIINLDTGKLEYWKGFQKTPQLLNRYGSTEYEGYYPCALMLEIPFDDIKDIDTVVEKMNGVSK